MSRREDYEEEYEDELDRMRAQRRRKAGARAGEQHVRRSYPVGPEIRSQQRNAPDLEDDFEITYLEEDPVPRQAPSKKRSASGSHRPPRRKKKKGKRLLLTLLLILAVAAAILFIKRWMKDRDGYWNIAVFGVDSRDGNLSKGALADVQMIASISRKTGEIRLVSVYRDTYVQIDDEGSFHKINEAYFKGGYQQALDTFERNLDIHVDDYATFNWKAVADAINILGGIDLEITDSEFKYINSFITATVESTGVYSTHLERAGMNHLDGVQAVAYSRLRLMDTDFNRTERQRKVVSLALEKAKQADLNTLKTVIATVIPEISTSIGVEDVIPLASNVNRYYLGQTGGFPFAKTTAMISKMDCVVPMTLESNVILLHQFLFDDAAYVPSSSVKEISQKICEITGIYEEGTATGVDSNLTGSSGSSGGSSGAGTPAPQPAAPEETPVQETAAAETAPSQEEESDEESLEAEEESSEKENSNEENKDPSKDNPAHVEPLEPEESTLSQEQIYQGPGAAEPSSESPNVSQTKPTEESTEEYGPGFQQP